eukprot:4415570-Amphidinium_carterae.1
MAGFHQRGEKTIIGLIGKAKTTESFALLLPSRPLSQNSILAPVLENLMRTEMSPASTKAAANCTGIVENTQWPKRRNFAGSSPRRRKE